VSGSAIAGVGHAVPRTVVGNAAIALAVAAAEGRLVDGDRVLLATFGAGLVWGGAVVEWGAG
jgi:3-oxoacyl-[acyl-carrier-protein] synthase III